MNAKEINTSDLIAYLEKLRDIMGPDDWATSLTFLRDDFGPNGFITALKATTASSAYIHYKVLAEFFENPDGLDELRVRHWIDEKLMELRRQKAERDNIQTEIRMIQRIRERIRSRVRIRILQRIRSRVSSANASTNSRTGRRIVVFIDGTRNTPEELGHIPDYNEGKPPPITNVIRLLRGVMTDDNNTSLPQIIGYFRGVATEGSTITKLIDAGSGRGLSRIILDAYRFISHNLEWFNTDQARTDRDQIYIFGFSRGAYAARSLNGFLNRFGLVKKQELWRLPFFYEAHQKLLASGGDLDPIVKKIWLDCVHPEYHSIPVHFLGVWDTVGALGIPVSGLSWITVDYERLHDTSLTPNVTHAYQALAIHELRHPFKPVFWTSKARTSQIVEQVWFAGAHANVGGGYKGVGLSSYSLDWMAYKAQKAGLELDAAYFARELAWKNINEPIAISRRFGHGESGLIKGRKMYLKAFERPLELKGSKGIETYLKEYFPAQTMALNVFKDMMAHWSVAERLSLGPTYVDDKACFERLDELSRALPLVSRAQSLV